MKTYEKIIEKAPTHNQSPPKLVRIDLEYRGHPRAELQLVPRWIPNDVMKALAAGVDWLLGDPTLIPGYSYPIDVIGGSLTFEQLIKRARNTESLIPLAVNQAAPGLYVVIWRQYLSVPRFVQRMKSEQVGSLLITEELEGGGQ